ncbi:M23 family metallopeptidase [Desulfotomaculum nigrificans]|uniref:M23 family metallopeptidase n=1 Tax=Desulfotomaculum nigrificans TaxID=1565 RepID=UPI0001FAE914|nr:M23 family metallopeptidase [Desulfotomaculum nigrificans]
MKIGRISFSKFKKKRMEPLNTYYNPDDWASAYNYSSRWRRKKTRGGGWKTFYRIVVALGIFAVLLVIKESPHPWSQQARNSLKVALTTEWDITPMLDKAVEIGLKTVNMDWPLFHELSNQAVPAMTEKKQEAAWTIPVSGHLVQEFGWVKNPEDNLERFNSGIDIAASAGSPVKSVQPGKVSRIGSDRTYGEFVLVEHRRGEYALYAGVTDITVSEGEQVEAGQVIGKVAQPDKGDPVLHFEVRENDKLVDPLSKISLSSLQSESNNQDKAAAKKETKDNSKSQETTKQ